MYSILADSILIFHILFIAIVINSVPLIIIGGWRRWQWVRSPLFRYTHLGMIGFVAFEAIVGMACPLTVWENDLRISMGETGYQGEDFIASWLHSVVFFAFPHWVFTLVYLSFGLLVASLFYFVPVRRNRKHA